MAGNPLLKPELVMLGGSFHVPNRDSSMENGLILLGKCHCMSALVFMDKILHVPNPSCNTWCVGLQRWGDVALLGILTAFNIRITAHLSYVFRGHGRDCAQTQPAARGAMSSLGQA